jgi:tetratricopeptide (TPR) repeat protein
LAESTIGAIEAFEQVITAWPEFPPAHIGLTLSHLQSPIFQLSTNKAAWYVAQREARRALALDSRLPEALGALGAVEFLYGWDWHAAESHLERAVGAQPACPEPYIYYGDFLDAVGRPAEALAIKRRALQIDPMSTMVHLRIASSYVFLRRYKEAIEWTRKALALDPNNVTAQYRLASTCYMTGEYDEWARLAISLAGYLGHPAEAASEMKEEYRRNGRASLVRQLLPRGERCTPAYTVWAKCYLECGDKEQALVCLERAFEERDRGLVHLNVDPSWDGLRGEERFADLLRRMDLA